MPIGGAADVAEDDQKIQLFILAFNQIKEVESGVAFGSGKGGVATQGASGMI